MPCVRLETATPGISVKCKLKASIPIGLLIANLNNSEAVKLSTICLRFLFRTELPKLKWRFPHSDFEMRAHPLVGLR